MTDHDNRIKIRGEKLNSREEKEIRLSKGCVKRDKQEILNLVKYENVINDETHLLETLSLCSSFGKFERGMVILEYFPSSGKYSISYGEILRKALESNDIDLIKLMVLFLSKRKEVFYYIEYQEILMKCCSLKRGMEIINSFLYEFEYWMMKFRGRLISPIDLCVESMKHKNVETFEFFCNRLKKDEFSDFILRFVEESTPLEGDIVIYFEIFMDMHKNKISFKDLVRHSLVCHLRNDILFKHILSNYLNIKRSFFGYSHGDYYLLANEKNLKEKWGSHYFTCEGYNVYCRPTLPEEIKIKFRICFKEYLSSFRKKSANFAPK